jgi:hypothetical protein
MRRLVLLVASLCAMMTPDMGTALRAQSLPPARWREIPWPFPRDAWPAGKAFRCDSPACGGDTVLSVRVKLGFCSCTGGVRDDDEVDNVADVDMITPDFVATGPGEVIKIAHFSGRIRSYEYDAQNQKRRTALGVALGHQCDLIAVSVNSPMADAPALKEQAMLRLNSQDVIKWIHRQLGGK